MLSLLAKKKGKSKNREELIGKANYDVQLCGCCCSFLIWSYALQRFLKRLQLELHYISGVEESRALAGTEMDVSIINSKVSMTSGLASGCCISWDFLRPNTQHWQLPVLGEFSQEPWATLIQRWSEPWFYRWAAAELLQMINIKLYYLYYGTIFRAGNIPVQSSLSSFVWEHLGPRYSRSSVLFANIFFFLWLLRLLS